MFGQPVRDMEIQDQSDRLPALSKLTVGSGGKNQTHLERLPIVSLLTRWRRRKAGWDLGGKGQPYLGRWGRLL